MTPLILIDNRSPTAGGDKQRPFRFCSRCGPGAPELHRRVCGGCGMGMVLTCSHDALPGDAAPFLIVTSALAVSAVSLTGEELFGKQQELVGTHLLELLTSPLGDDRLERFASLAAGRSREPVVLPVRPRPNGSQQASALTARIATCGPPRAALVAIEAPGLGLR